MSFPEFSTGDYDGPLVHRRSGNSKRSARWLWIITIVSLLITLVSLAILAYVFLSKPADSKNENGVNQIDGQQKAIAKNGTAVKMPNDNGKLENTEKKDTEKNDTEKKDTEKKDTEKEAAGIVTTEEKNKSENAEQGKAAPVPAEQGKTEKENTENFEKDDSKKENAEKEKPEQAEKEKAEKDAAEREQAEKEKAEKEKAEKERVEKAKRAEAEKPIDLPPFLSDLNRPDNPVPAKYQVSLPPGVTCDDIEMIGLKDVLKEAVPPVWTKDELVVQLKKKIISLDKKIPIAKFSLEKDQLSFAWLAEGKDVAREANLLRNCVLRVKRADLPTPAIVPLRKPRVLPEMSFHFVSSSDSISSDSFGIDSLPEKKGLYLEVINKPDDWNVDYEKDPKPLSRIEVKGDVRLSFRLTLEPSVPNNAANKNDTTKYFKVRLEYRGLVDGIDNRYPLGKFRSKSDFNKRLTEISQKLPRVEDELNRQKDKAVQDEKRREKEKLESEKRFLEEKVIPAFQRLIDNQAKVQYRVYLLVGDKYPVTVISTQETVAQP